MLGVGEEGIGDRLGQVAEPDIAEGGVVREALYSEEKSFDNAEKKSTIPLFIRQKVFPASRGDKIRLHNELFSWTMSVCAETGNRKRLTLNP